MPLISKVVKSRNKQFSQGTHSFLNPYSYYLLRKNKFRDLEKIQYIHLDGGLLSSLFSKLITPINRVSFDYSSIAEEVFLIAKKKKLKIAVIGSDEASNKKFVEFLKNKYEIPVPVFYNGFFNREEKKQIIAKLTAESIDLLVVGMGTPHQERFICEVVENINIKYIYSCGGFIHQTATHKSEYYPYWINYFNLRWAYRIFDEPKLSLRYLLVYPIAIVFIIKDIIQHKRGVS